MKLCIFNNGDSLPYKEFPDVTKLETERQDNGKLLLHVYRFHSYVCSVELDMRYVWFILEEEERF